MMKDMLRSISSTAFLILILVTGQAAGLKCYECTGTGYECSGSNQVENTCDSNLNEDRCMVAKDNDKKEYRQCITSAGCSGFKGLSEVSNILNSLANAFGQDNVIESGYRCCKEDLCNLHLDGHVHKASGALLLICAVVVTVVLM